MQTSLVVSFGLYDTTARQDSTLAFGAGQQEFSDLLDLKNEEGAFPPAAATLEEDYFLLDGSFSPFPDDPSEEDWGLWSQELSDEEGNFSQPLCLEADFSGIHSSVGLTLCFDRITGDCPSQVTVRWYDSAGTLLYTKSFTGSGKEWILENKVENYGKIQLEFPGTSKPGRYLKVTGLDYGIMRTLGPEELVSANLTEEMDPLSARLPVNTLEFTLHSDDKTFSLMNPQSDFSALQQRQRIKATGYQDNTPLPLGKFYLQSWENSGDGSIHMVCQDAVGLLDGSTFLGGIYDGVSGIELMQEILDSAGADYRISPQLADRQLSGWLPVCSHREALQRTAFAMGALVTCARRDWIALEPAQTKPTVLIPMTRKLEGQQTGLREQVTGVDLTVHSYMPGEERKQLFRETLKPGTHRVILNQPAYSLEVSGGKLEGSGANYGDILVETEGEVTLTGIQYVVGKRVVSGRTAMLPPGEAENVLTVEDATILDVGWAGDLAQRVLDYYNQRHLSKFIMLPGEEEPSWNVMVEDRSGNHIRGRIESMETDLTGGFLARIQMTGTPVSVRWRHYAGELYAGESMGVI